MASQINASNSGFGGIVSTGDSSGVLQLQTVGTTAVTLDTSQNATFAGKVTSAGALTLASNGSTTAVTIDTSQNVGIGTATVARTNINSTNTPVLQIEGITANTSAYAAIRNSNDSNPPRLWFAKSRGTSVGSNTIVQNNDVVGTIAFTGSDGTNFIYTAAIDSIVNGTPGTNDMPGALLFSTTPDGSPSPTERMRIDSSGHVYIATTNSAPRDFTSGGGCVIRPPANTFEFASTDSNLVFFNYTATAAGSATFITFRQQGSNRGSISTNGSTTAYNTTSDYRLKENIVPMTGALDIVAQLKPSTYTWKETGVNSQGFIAHELAEVVPDCVTGEKDAVETYTDEEGNEKTKIKPQGVDASFLVATLTAAIQEQQTIINDLKARIETLEAK